METTFETRKGCNSSMEHRVKITHSDLVIYSPWLYTMNSDLENSFKIAALVEVTKKLKNLPTKFVEIAPNTFVLPAGLF